MRCELPKASIRTLPAQAPLREEVLAAIDLAEGELQGLRIERPAHILVGSTQHCWKNDDYVSHACSATLSKGSFRRLGPGVYACAPALVFALAGGQKTSDVALLELAYELCGTYSTPLTCEKSVYNTSALATADELADYARRNGDVKGARKALRLARFVADGSASPRETKLALLLGLPHTMGGGGLGIPRMNYEVEATREARLIAQRASFRCDLCWPEACLDVEYQSRAIHGNEASRIDDSRRENALHAMGWEVVGVTNEELDSQAACDVITSTLAKRLGKDPRVRTKDYRERKMSLRAELGLPTDSWSTWG